MAMTVASSRTQALQLTTTCEWEWDNAYVQQDNACLPAEQCRIRRRHTPWQQPGEVSDENHTATAQHLRHTQHALSLSFSLPKHAFASLTLLVSAFFRAASCQPRTHKIEASHARTK